MRIHIEDAVVDHVQHEPADRRAVFKLKISVDDPENPVFSGRFAVQERDVYDGIGRRFPDDERKFVFIHGSAESARQQGEGKREGQHFFHLDPFENSIYLLVRSQRSKIGYPGCCVQLPSWTWARVSNST
ncbi:hypothetical protein SDC9_142724 [bioreactor metagenome]|uniref:Uncharacterized protein n=1 Tax=bioreactor metagenome TaxID=1076179 RepID=A0A645E1Z0_9ZZZZ